MWAVYAPFIDRAIEKATYANETTEGIREALIAGDQFLVEIKNDDTLFGVAVLMQLDLKDGQVLHVHSLAGDFMDYWLEDFVSFLKDMARGLRCEGGVSCTGRLGWERTLKQYGFKPAYVNLRLEL